MPVAVDTFVTSEADTADAIRDLDAQMTARGVSPHFLFVFYTPEYRDGELHRFLTERFPDVPVVGGSSACGVMSAEGVAADRSLGVLAITDPDGSFGAVSTPLTGNVADAAERALYAALAAAGAAGELPDLVWIYQPPGQEEAVMEGLRRVVGDRCAIVGGTAAAPPAEQWRQLGPDGPSDSNLVVGVLFPSGGIALSYQGGFEPTGHTGMVTRLSDAHSRRDEHGVLSGRIVLQIDGEPAVKVYNRWLGGVIAEDVVEAGGDITALSTRSPLGVATGEIRGLPYYRLIGVERVSSEGGLVTHANIEEGSRIYLMRGNEAGLIHRAGRVAKTAMSLLSAEGGDGAGAVMTYCMGCRVAVGDGIGRVASTARDAFGGLPFIGFFSSGEQGPTMGVNVHGNLMISAVVFGR